MSNAKDRAVARIHKVLTIIGFSISAVLIAAASRGDLYIDEIASLQDAQNARTWWEIITQNPSDNNHLLNTFLLHLLGNQKHLFVFRLPAVLFGIATLVVLVVTARRQRTTESVWVLYLAGLSCPMILYFSEARGYAPAMFFAAASFEWIQRCWDRNTGPRLYLFWTLLVLGFLSHFSFAMIALSLGFWSWQRKRNAGTPVLATLRELAKYYAVPALFMACVYWVYIRHMNILGGPVYSRWEVIGSATSAALGFVDEPAMAFFSFPCALAAVAYGTWIRRRQDRGDWIFFPLVLIVVPMAVIMVANPKYLYFRYFMVCFPFFYLLLAGVLAEWTGRSKRVKTVAVLLFVIFSVGHFFKVASLVTIGRANFRRALTDMAAATSGPIIRVGSDHDFRHRTVIEFYARFLPPSKNVEYIPRKRRSVEKPEWIITHGFDPSFPPFKSLEVAGIGKYELFGVYPYCGLSGWIWYVYQRPNGTSASPKPAEF